MMETIIQSLIATAAATILGAPFLIGLKSKSPDRVQQLFRTISDALGYICYGWVAFCFGGFFAPKLANGTEGPMLLAHAPWSWLLPALLAYWASISIFNHYVLSGNDK